VGLAKDLARLLKSLVGHRSSCHAKHVEVQAMYDEDEDLTTGEVLTMALVVLVFVPIIWVVEQWRKIRG
jgi:uncharacterized ion transporter superfamily protein YfcC